MKAKWFFTRIFAAGLMLTLAVSTEVGFGSLQSENVPKAQCPSSPKASIAFPSFVFGNFNYAAASLETGRLETLSPEVEAFIAGTYLAHMEEHPDPNEPVEVLSRYLEGQELLRHRQVNEAVLLFSRAIQRFPESRHAYTGLGSALWQRYKTTGAREDLRAAVDEFLNAAQIGMKFGKVRYTYRIAVGLAQLGDRISMGSRCTPMKYINELQLNYRLLMSCNYILKPDEFA